MFSLKKLLVIGFTAAFGFGMTERYGIQATGQQKQMNKDVSRAHNEEWSADLKNVSNPRDAGMIAGKWSKPVNDLSARLLVTLDEIKSADFPSGGSRPRPGQSCFRYEVMLEVKNVGGVALAFINQPSFTDIEVRDANGKKVLDGGLDQSGPSPLPQWAVIPGGSYLGVRVDMTHLAPRPSSALLGDGGYARFLEPGKHSLGATLVATPGKAPAKLWTGEIKVPPVSFTFKDPASDR